MRRGTLIFVVVWFSAMTVWAQGTPPPTIPITPIPSQVGDTFEVLGDSYRILEMNFLRFDTDTPYIIKFPSLVQQQEDVSLHFAHLQVQWVENSSVQIVEFPFTAQISGFPAGVSESKFSLHTYTEASVPFPGVVVPGQFELRYEASIGLAVAIGPETIVSLQYAHSMTSGGVETTFEALVGAAPLLEVIPLRPVRLQQLEALRTLLNYIEIRPQTSP